MRLPDRAHTDRPWRVHQITADFHLEDVWALPVRGGPDDLDQVVGRFGSGESPLQLPGLAGLLWSIRQWLGTRLGWDRADAGLGGRVSSLRERLPADLPAEPDDPARDFGPFRPIFRTHDEWAAEVANRTVHGVLHLGWVADTDGRHFAQMAVLVRPNGRLGRAYMAAIAPLRHLIVYPQLMRSLERARSGAETGSTRV